MRLLLAALSLLVLSALAAPAPAGASLPTSAAATATYCEEAKTLSLSGHSASTPRVCVPVP